MTEGYIKHRFLVHDVLYKHSWRDRHLAEVLDTDLVIFEIPLAQSKHTSDATFEHRLLTLATDLLQHGVAIVIFELP